MIQPIPDIDALIFHLAIHCAEPQKSERWAMYRLITPVVDFACQKTGLKAVFEFNQTSAHGTSQSVDIALQDDGVSKVLIEAKRANRTISRQQIAKYLEPNLSGVVSNGIDWILCQDEDGRHLRIWDQNEKVISRQKVQQIVDFLAGAPPVGDEVGSDVDIKPSVRPQKLEKTHVASRKSHAVQTIDSVETLATFSARNGRLTGADKAFLDGFSTSLKDGVLPTAQIEARETRLSVWDTSSGRRERWMRIEFGKRQPSVLIRTKILDYNPHIAAEFVHHRHDKHGGMREFRLPDEDQARSLGLRLSVLCS